MSGGLLIINNTEQGTSIALWLYKQCVPFTCILLFPMPPVTQPSLWDCRESTHAGRHAHSTITWTSQAAWITEVISFSQIRFSLQGNRWGSFPFGLNSAVRDETLHYSSALSGRISTPSPASQPCWDLYSLSTAAPPPIETAGIFSVTVALLCVSGVCFGLEWH